MDIQQLRTIEEFQEIADNNSSFVIMKHSLTCPISAEANRQFENYREEATIPLFRLYVQEVRELSNYIAEHYGVKHESPQVIQLINGQAVKHLNHDSITTENLKTIG
ncbi:bacillithiol system redox-active protein YtxJ [Gracilibacillus timonensis]|uniref:bacillithiol system redox-active protein YtxJ n=1 Tax=Gracilibacillus timonensis TaxID=1816696 RepID=UPI000825DC0E|nr:bacillithiol system redox-active protein YtxJ [Gracilibacillus timonensis]